MKLDPIFFMTALVVAAVSADPDARRCWRPGQPCSRLKRATYVATPILEEHVDTASSKSKACFAPSQPCAKARCAEGSPRASLKDASTNDNEDDGKKDFQDQLHKNGVACPKGSTKSPATKSSPQPYAKAGEETDADQFYCHRAGQPCHKVKRAAEALAEALALPEAGPKADPRRCWRPGQPCSKTKRSSCPRNDQPCARARKAMDYLEAAAKGALDYVTERLLGLG